MQRILFITLASLIILASSRSPPLCKPGRLQIDGQCVKCPYVSGCAQYEAHGKCKLCKYGYKLSEYQTCDYVQTPNSDCCSLFDDDGNCIQCAPGLYLEKNSCFEIVRPGCLEGEGNICDNCAAEYNLIHGKCKKKIEWCSVYDEDGICQACEIGYIVVQGICAREFEISTGPNCAVANEYGCVQCEDKYYLTQDKRCKPFQAGCLKYFQEQCLFCEPSFNLIEGKCLIEGCTLYNSRGCIQCSSQYQLKDDRCWVENCFEASNGICYICNENYRLANGKCVTPRNDRCEGCARGFIEDLSGNCIRQIRYCEKYGSFGKCVNCVQPFLLINQRCQIPNCEEYHKGGCKLCRKPFILKDDFCYLPYCELYNEAWTECKNCEKGYHLENSLCVNDDPYCAAYRFVKGTATQICVECSKNYILNEENNRCEAKIPGCVYQYGKCISCEYPFKRVGDNCIIEGCLEYDFNGCSRCRHPFKQNRKTCIIPYCEKVVDGKCENCDDSYHLVKGQCVKNDPKCKIYENNVCLDCISGYVFSQGRCVRYIPHCKVIGINKCQQCDLGYRQNYGECLPTDEKCIRFNQFGCEECKEGYHTNKGLCKIDDPNCIDYSGPSNDQLCENCKRGYVYIAKTNYCVKQDPGCIYQGQVCAACKSPFVYNEVLKECYIPACHKYSDTGCYSCLFPFENNGGQCIIRFCDKYDWEQNNCMNCLSGYKLIQGKCYREDPKCVQYSGAGQCKLCIKQHIVFEGICVKQDQNCLKYSKNGGCNKCKDNYYKSPDNVCLPEEPGCIYQKGKCTLCKHPFNFHKQAQKCRIDGCLEAYGSGCISCRFPFEPLDSGICKIPNCANVKDNACARCTPGYHLKQGLYCVKDDPSCLRYNDDGDCQICARGYLLMSRGECEIAESNCVQMKKNGKCLSCKPEYFLNRFFQCQKRDENCEAYNNGACDHCKANFFLYDYICFPYTPGCVKYSGKDCVNCRKGWEMKNGECFKLKKQLLKIQGEDEHYNFEITPIDITKSKYYIDNLSPISKLGKILFSSFYSKQYTVCSVGTDETGLEYSKGWKAEHERSGQYLGFIIEEGEPVTFYALQLEAVEGSYIKKFYIEYSQDGINYIRIEKLFDGSHSSKDLTTIYFTAIYAKAIRIVIQSYVGWPATKLQFFYYDYIRFRKISSLKSLRYLKESIQSNFVDRMDNQMYINQRFYFQPDRTCSDHDRAGCFTGLELCQARSISSITVSCNQGWVSKIYLTYSIDGKSFNCYEKCREIAISPEDGGNTVNLNNLLAKNIRVYPVEWEGSAEMKIEYCYE